VTVVVLFTIFATVEVTVGTSVVVVVRLVAIVVLVLVSDTVLVLVAVEYAVAVADNEAVGDTVTHIVDAVGKMPTEELQNGIAKLGVPIRHLKRLSWGHVLFTGLRGSGTADTRAMPARANEKTFIMI